VYFKTEKRCYFNNQTETGTKFTKPFCTHTHTHTHPSDNKKPA